VAGTFGPFVAEPSTPEACALDGKSARGSFDGLQKAVHLLSLLAHGSGLSLAQAAVPNGVEEKTNEHKAALRLLEDLALEGRLVTGDATFCQHDFCRRVIDTRGAYLVFVKDNQPTLLSDITLNPTSTSLTALSRCITCGRFFSIRFVERSESERL
jgi:Transposase DDE domain